MFGLLGVLLTAGSVAVLWYFSPTNGRVHPLVTAPVFDTMLPIAILGGLAAGLAMIFTMFT